MIRQPTPPHVAYAWHTAALRGAAPANTGEPHPGWFKRRLVKGGVMVPARIWLYQDVDPLTGELRDDEQLQCEINGRYADPEEAWSWISDNPITEQEFRYLAARLDFAAANEPHDAFANPRKAVDLLTVPVPF